MMLLRLRLALLCLAALLVSGAAHADPGPLWFSPAPWSMLPAKTAPRALAPSSSSPSYSSAGHKLGSNIPIPSCSTSGNALTCPGVGATPTWGAVNLAGGSGSVTGVLPAANIPNLIGDANGPISGTTVTALNGHALPVGTGYLFWNGTAWTYAGGGSTSVTGTGLWYSAAGTLNSAAVGLSGDVSIAALSGGNVPVTVNMLSGAAPVNVVNSVLSFGASPALTGNLRLPNQGSIVFRNHSGTGDVSTLYTDSSGNLGVASEAGASIFLQPAGANAFYFDTAFAMHFGAGDTTPTITQDIAGAAGTTPVSLLITPQAPNGSCNASGPCTPGGIVVKFASAGATGTPSIPTMLFEQNTTKLVAIGPYQNANSLGAIWLGATAASNPTTGDYTLTADSGSAYLNSPGTSGAVVMSNGGTQSLLFLNSSAQVQVQVPTSQSGGLLIEQLTQTSSTAPPNVVIQPQFQAGVDEGSAAANTPGLLIANLGAPYTVSNPGAESRFDIQRNGTATLTFGPYPGTPTAGAIWLSTTSSGASRTTSNYALYEDSGQSLVGFPSAGFYSVVSAGSYVLKINATEMWNATDSALALGDATFRFKSANVGTTGFNVYHASGNASPTAQLGDAQLLFGTTTTQDVSFVRQNSGQVQFSNGFNGNAEWDVGGSSSANEISLISSSTTIKVAGTGGANATSTGLTLASQAVSATNGTPGNIAVNIPAPTGTGSEGDYVIQRGGSEEIALGGLPGSGATSAAIFLVPGTTPSSSNWTFGATSAQTGMNVPSGGVLAFDVNNAAQMNMDASSLRPTTAGGLTLGTTTQPWGAFVSGFTSTYAGYFLNGAAIGDATVNQTGVVSHARWFKKTSDTLAHTIASNVTSGQVETLVIDWNCKSEGGIGTGYGGGQVHAGCANSAGTVTCSASAADFTFGTCGSPTGCTAACNAPTITASGGTYVVTVQEGSSATGSWDWQMDVYVNDN